MTITRSRWPYDGSTVPLGTACRMRRKPRPWTLRDDQLLRQFHAEGKHDPTIAYILDRERQIIRLHRKRLGLPPHKWKNGGRKQSPETRAKLSELSRQRWREQRSIMLKGLAAAEAKARELRTFRPPKGTSAFKRYRKLCQILGPQAARAALAAGQI